MRESSAETACRSSGRAAVVRFVAACLFLAAMATPACAPAAGNPPSVAPSGPSSLAGKWMGSGYTCPRGSPQPDEQVSIADEGGTLTATKVTGDNCIGAGEVTWRGVASGTSFPVQTQVSSPGAPHKFVDARVTVRGPDLIALEGPGWTVTYRRIP